MIALLMIAMLQVTVLRKGALGVAQAVVDHGRPHNEPAGGSDDE